MNQCKQIIVEMSHPSCSNPLKTPTPNPPVAYVGQQGARPHALGTRQAVTGIDVDQTQVAILRPRGSGGLQVRDWCNITIIISVNWITPSSCK